MCPSCCQPLSSQPPVPGCVDKLPAACVDYSSEQSVKEALDQVKLPVLVPALITFLTQNPSLRLQLKALLQ